MFSGIWYNITSRENLPILSIPVFFCSPGRGIPPYYYFPALLYSSRFSFPRGIKRNVYIPALHILVCARDTKRDETDGIQTSKPEKGMHHNCDPYTRCDQLQEGHQNKASTHWRNEKRKPSDVSQPRCRRWTIIYREWPNVLFMLCVSLVNEYPLCASPAQYRDRGLPGMG
jgi:hypothetical protein